MSNATHTTMPKPTLNSMFTTDFLRDVNTTPQLIGVMKKISRDLLWVLLFIMIAVSIWTPLSGSYYYEKWLTAPQIYYLAPLPLLSLIAFILAYKHLGKSTHDAIPFLCIVSVFFLSFLGFSWLFCCLISHSLAYVYHPVVVHRRSGSSIASFDKLSAA